MAPRFAKPQDIGDSGLSQGVAYDCRTTRADLYQLGANFSCLDGERCGTIGVFVEGTGSRITTDRYVNAYKASSSIQRLQNSA
jgi:hypothetical protein